MRLEVNDQRDGLDSVCFSIAFEESVARKIMGCGSRAAESMRKSLSYVQWPLRVSGKWVGSMSQPTLEDGCYGGVPSQDAQALESGEFLEPIHLAMYALEIPEMLPLVIIPERRSMTLPLRLEVQQVSDVVVENVFTGNHILPTILDWQCTGSGRLSRVEMFVSDVLGKEVSIHCSPAEKTVFIAVGTAPPRRIESLGSGIAEILTLAIAVVSFSEGGLLLYEEPELHLHPDVQRRILDKMRQPEMLSKWQILATTHSEHILARWHDSSVFCCAEVFPEFSGSRLSSSAGREVLRSAIMRLGGHPGSVLAAKSIVWVEGPSDALYVRCFLSDYAPHLVESRDFSFAFFGGSLLTHMRMSQFRSDEIVDLFLVHPNSFVVFDSDRQRGSDPLGKEYARDFAQTAIAGRVWVTRGREMENYLPDEVLSWAATADMSTQIPFVLDRDFGVFHEQVAYVRDRAGRRRAHKNASDSAKVDFAAEVVRFLADNPGVEKMARLDLNDRIAELATFVERAVGRPYREPGPPAGDPTLATR